MTGNHSMIHVYLNVWSRKNKTDVKHAMTRMDFVRCNESSHVAGLRQRYLAGCMELWRWDLIASRLLAGQSIVNISPTLKRSFPMCYCFGKQKWLQMCGYCITNWRLYWRIVSIHCSYSYFNEWIDILNLLICLLTNHIQSVIHNYRKEMSVLDILKDLEILSSPET